jgi:hypothetical protein
MKFLGEPVVTDPCNPSPCGPNAQCRNGQCSCLPEFQGDPYQGCRPECVQSTDCPRDKACMQRKCRDPCPGTCGQSAVCLVSNHVPMCSCPSGMQGDPFVACRPVPGNLFRLFYSSTMYLFDNIYSSCCHPTMPSKPLWAKQSMQRNK